MIARLRGLGFVLAVMGILFIAGGAFAFVKTQEGLTSLNALSAAQDVKISYNEQGQLVDRGETAGAEAIMALLRDDWKYPVNLADLNPNDPVVNTASEYMYQMATITYHTLQQHPDGSPSRGRHGRRWHGLSGRHVRVRGRRTLLERLRSIQPDRGCGSREGLDRHGPCTDRAARRRDGHRLGPPVGPWDRRPLRRYRVPRPHRRTRPGVGGSGPGGASDQAGTPAEGHACLTTSGRRPSLNPCSEDPTRPESGLHDLRGPPPLLPVHGCQCRGRAAAPIPNTAITQSRVMGLAYTVRGSAKGSPSTRFRAAYRRTVRKASPSVHSPACRPSGELLFLVS